MTTLAGPLISRLSRAFSLSQGERAALESLVNTTRRFAARAPIARERDAPPDPFVLLAGMACEFRFMSDGRRQILSIIVPGDIRALHLTTTKSMDHSIATVTPSVIATISLDNLAKAKTAHPNIERMMAWSAAQDEAIQREHLVALGRRDARGRVAYLLCDLMWRCHAAGIGSGGRVKQPMITQSDVADALGLTPVHVNRIVQALRKANLVHLDRHELRVLAPSRLAALADDLTPSYLHLDESKLAATKPEPRSSSIELSRHKGSLRRRAA